MLRRLLFAALTLSASNALAWSDAGHKIVASVAYRQVPPEQVEKIIAILKQHPRFEEDFKSKLPAELTSEKEQSEFYFQQSAIQSRPPSARTCIRSGMGSWAERWFIEQRAIVRSLHTYAR